MSETGFQEEFLNTRSHNDPDRHWIGESLPRASDEEITFSGTETRAGDSIFSAPADHSHDFRTRWGGFRSNVPATGKAVGAGATVFLDDLVHVWGPDNFLNPAFPTQLIDFPVEEIGRAHV